MRGTPEALAAARLRAASDYPYLATALWGLHPVPQPGLGTMSVDKWWRLYYDPAILESWSLKELAGVLKHEVSHLLREHAERAEAIQADPLAWNLAADAEINDDLIAEGVTLPGDPIVPSKLGAPDGRMAEEYYEHLMNQPPPPGGGGSPGDDGEPGDAGDQDGEEGGSGIPGDGDGQDAGQPGDGDPGDTGDGDGEGDGEGQGQGHGQSQQDSGDGNGQGDGQDGDDASNGDGGSGGGSDASNRQQPDDGNGGSGGGGDTDPSEGGTGGGGAGDSADTEGPGSGGEYDSTKDGNPPSPGGGRCGSAASGSQEPWEQGPPDDKTAPGLKGGESALIRRRVAHAIQEHQKSRGNVPGSWQTWADQILEPKVNWRRVLTGAVRATVADVAGQVDYSYSRPSRRQSAFPDHIAPTMRAPLPNITLEIDSSGSMSDKELATALGGVASVLKQLGLYHGVKVYVVDAAIQAAKQVLTPKQLADMGRGRGGTDMRIGILKAMEDKPRPDVIIVLTDGDTPWPERHQVAGVRLVVGLILRPGREPYRQPPEWARVVRIEVE